MMERGDKSSEELITSDNESDNEVQLNGDGENQKGDQSLKSDEENYKNLCRVCGQVTQTNRKVHFFTQTGLTNEYRNRLVSAMRFLNNEPNYTITELDSYPQFFCRKCQTRLYSFEKAAYNLRTVYLKGLKILHSSNPHAKENSSSTTTTTTTTSTSCSPHDLNSGLVNKSESTSDQLSTLKSLPQQNDQKKSSFSQSPNFSSSSSSSPTLSSASTKHKQSTHSQTSSPQLQSQPPPQQQQQPQPQPHHHHHHLQQHNIDYSNEPWNYSNFPPTSTLLTPSSSTSSSVNSSPCHSPSHSSPVLTQSYHNPQNIPTIPTMSNMSNMSNMQNKRLSRSKNSPRLSNVTQHDQFSQLSQLSHLSQLSQFSQLSQLSQLSQQASQLHSGLSNPSSSNLIFSNIPELFDSSLPQNRKRSAQSMELPFFPENKVQSRNESETQLPKLPQFDYLNNQTSTTDLDDSKYQNSVFSNQNQNQNQTQGQMYTTTQAQTQPIQAQIQFQTQPTQNQFSIPANFSNNLKPVPNKTY